jgi:hypothetical protein
LYQTKKIVVIFSYNFTMLFKKIQNIVLYYCKQKNTSNFKIQFFIRVGQNKVFIQTLFNSEPLFRPFLQAFPDEFSKLERHMFRKNNLRVHNFVVSLIVRVRLKRWVTNCKLISQHTDFPNVNGRIVTRSFDHFWCQVVQSATKGVSAFIRVNGPPKIGQFDIS